MQARLLPAPDWRCQNITCHVEWPADTPILNRLVIRAPRCCEAAFRARGGQQSRTLRGESAMKYAAELFGTFVLVFAGLTTAVIPGGQVHNVGGALAFGLSLLAMAYALGPISGCHINPAVTLGMVMARRMDLREAAGYWIAQCIGGFFASGIV